MKAKSLLFALIAIASTFTLGSCKKDNSPAKSFSYNSTNYETPYSFAYGEKSDNVEYTDLAFISFNPVQQTYTGKVSTGVIEFAINPLVPGTYTYKAFDAEGFDKTKNFASSDFSLGMQYNSGVSDDATGTQLSSDDLTAGTVTITKNGTSYSVSYNLTYKSGAVSGQYNGLISGLE